ncbi:MAG TPA: hypothetical protein VFS76_19790 [Pyrinomonadaceae bacterium]|nr:hypothetical protein [Pyrinomonadaceae bacterium]
MATREQSERSLRLQLERDAPNRLKQAGPAWKEATMGFYYGNTQNSEISVDMAIRASTLRLLHEDGTGLPPKIWKGLVALVNTSTTAAAAIETMRFATAHGVPLTPV